MFASLHSKLRHVFPFMFFGKHRFALCRQGEYELAQSALAQALAADPSSELSLYYMALLQHR